MTPFYDKDGITIYHGDSLEVLPRLGSVDHVITDPPYSQRTHDRARSLKDGGSDIPIEFAALTDFSFVPRLIALSRRWTICFCSLEHFGAYAEAAGDDTWVRAAIWHRTDGTPQISGDRPAQAAEGIAIMHTPGPKRWHGGGNRGLWACGVVRDAAGRVHPTQKPLPLMRELVRLFTDPGDLILDPFMGSGTTLVAARLEGRRAIGIELEEKWCQVAVDRLEHGDKGAAKIASGMTPFAWEPA